MSVRIVLEPRLQNLSLEGAALDGPVIGIHPEAVKLQPANAFNKIGIVGAKHPAFAAGVTLKFFVDRGFLDGKVLYEIDQQGIEFVIPLKRNMEAAKDARQLALDCKGHCFVGLPIL